MEIPTQLASQPMALFLIGGFLGMLALTPLPTVPLLIAAIGTAGVGWFVRDAQRAVVIAKETEARKEAEAERAQPKPVEELLGVDTLELEVGYGLVRLVGGDLLDRIAMIRHQLASELGLVMPPVRIRDNMQLPPDRYRLKIRGATVDEGEVHPDLLMAMDSGLADRQARGASGQGARLRARCDLDRSGPSDAGGDPELHGGRSHERHRHPSHRSRSTSCRRAPRPRGGRQPRRAAQAVGRRGSSKRSYPPSSRWASSRRSSRALLRESVPIRDLETIVETVGDWIAHTRDPDVLVEYVRNALASHRSAPCTPRPTAEGGARLHVVTMDPAVEDRVNGYIDRGAGGTTVSVPPQLAGDVARAVADAAKPLLRGGTTGDRGGVADRAGAAPSDPPSASCGGGGSRLQRTRRRFRRAVGRARPVECGHGSCLRCLGVSRSRADRV